MIIGFGPQSRAQSGAAETLETIQRLYEAGQYFVAARTAFAAVQGEGLSKAEAYSWITISLVQARLYHSASYFFIRTLQSKNRRAIRRVLTQVEPLVLRLGSDLFRKYLVKYTKEADYSPENRSTISYLLGKDALLIGKPRLALRWIRKVKRQSPVWPYALQMRGTAYAVLNSNGDALRAFRDCRAQADRIVQAIKGETQDAARSLEKQQRRQAEDLRARCQAGIARTYYQAGQFEKADYEYDQIPKASFVWTDILFEQGWNAFSRDQYNRTLGKLVTYKSPALQFVFNTEVDVLRAQSFLALCQYSDANQAINEFNKKYAGIGKKVKEVLESDRKLDRFYRFGKNALNKPLHTKNRLASLANRFVRGPYFQALVNSERLLVSEKRAVQAFNERNVGSGSSKRGFPGFLNLVLGWRKKTIELLGGAYVKNSLIDYYNIILNDFEKIAFIKLEMLRQAKDKLLDRSDVGGFRGRGDVLPSRRDDQLFWTFNGEFWNDELGDYVFGLKSEC